MIEFIQNTAEGTIIKVFGVGGAGGNAVDHMIRTGIKGVEFIAANTDSQALERSLADRKIRLGASGLGAGSKPEAGRAAAQESREQIEKALEGAHMAFITAGMGGGTGTGAAPVIAEVAKEMGVLTVGVVTKPFDFENRDRVADSGIDELSRHADSLIVVLNNKLLEVYGDDASFEECFRNADNVLASAVAGIAEIINIPGMVNVDFQDVRTAMSEMGRAMMGSAEASGRDRARVAAELAAASPLLEGTALKGARCVLVNITSGRALKMSEVRDAVKTVQAYASKEAFVKYGTVFREDMDDRIRITVVATGMSGKPEIKLVSGGDAYSEGTGIGIYPGNEQFGFGRQPDWRREFSDGSTPLPGGESARFEPSMGGQAAPIGEATDPAVIRSNRRPSVGQMLMNSLGHLDTPAFLRRPAN